MDTDERDLPSWDGASYARNTAHHRAHDARFLAPLNLRGDERILDIGCGSGDLTAAVAALVPDGHVVGIDAQPSMLDEARRIAADNQSFELCAAQDIAGLRDSGPGAEPFDVVLSRAALHWVPAAEHAQVLRGAYELLRPGGVIRLEMGGAGNIASVVELCDELAEPLGGPSRPWCFADAGWYYDQLDAAGFQVGDNDVLTVAQRRRFDRAGFDDWFSSQVQMAYTSAMEPAAAATFRERFAQRAHELARSDGSYDRIYVRLEALARR